MKKKKPPKSFRISRDGFSLPFYLLMFIAVCILAALPALFYGGSSSVIRNISYLKWYLIYCVILAFAICVAIIIGKRRSIDRPIKKLSEAARQVADGDFSVYLPIRHASDKMDNMDMLYEDFNSMVAGLGSIETLQNDFAANVSHEIKTPLSGINNYLQLLEQTELTDEQKEYVASALESSERLAALVYNILRLNKLENQSIKPQAERYDLCRQLADCAIGFESIWEKKKIEFEAEMEDEAFICADEELMELVWNNLLSNAFKFTEAGGTVKIREYSEGKNIIIEVSDTGCGMSKETAAHMFDKFYQGDTSHSAEGNGLGMPLALRVLQMSGGTISVKSTEGEGSTFTVRLQANEAHESAQETARIEIEEKESYAGYEYCTITVPIEYSSLYMDNYECFGWEPDVNMPDMADRSGKNMLLHFRRKRNLRNRTELTRLQRNFDGLVGELGMLERSKTVGAVRYAWAVAFSGTVLITGSVFAVTAEPPLILLCALLGAPGIALWVLPYFTKKHFVRKRTEKAAPVIEAKYDELYEICSKGRRLLS